MKRNPAAEAEIKEKQRKREALAFFAQKREMFAVNALVGILYNRSLSVDNVDTVTALAVKYADAMMDKLYDMEQTSADE